MNLVATLPGPITLAFSGAVPIFAQPVLDLAHSEPAFDQTLRRCDAIVQNLAGWSLFEQLDLSRHLGPVVEFTWNTPLFLSVQLSLLEVLKHRGLRAYTVLGLSGGEVSAAYAASMIDLETALRIAVAIPVTLERQARHLRMVTVSGVPPALACCLEPEVAVAAYMSSHTITLSGPPDPLNVTLARLQDWGADVRPMPFGWGVHHPALEADSAFFHQYLGDLNLATPTCAIELCSQPGAAEKAFRSGHVWNMVYQPVYFSRAVTQLQQRGLNTFVSVGFGASLTGLLANLGGQSFSFQRALDTLRSSDSLIIPYSGGGPDDILNPLA